MPSSFILKGVVETQDRGSTFGVTASFICEQSVSRMTRDAAPPRDCRAFGMTGRRIGAIE